MYDASKIAEQLNISKVTAYAKMKLPEVKPFIIMQNSKSFVDEKGLEAIKQSLKYNTTQDEVAVTTELETLKVDMIQTLKDNIEFLKEQLNVKDNQIQDIRKLFENTQVLFKNDQEKNKTLLLIPETIREHDIELVNSLTLAMEKQRDKYKLEIEQEKLKKKNNLFLKLLNLFKKNTTIQTK